MGHKLLKSTRRSLSGGMHIKESGGPGAFTFGGAPASLQDLLQVSSPEDDTTWLFVLSDFLTNTEKSVRKSEKPLFNKDNVSVSQHIACTVHRVRVRVQFPIN